MNLKLKYKKEDKTISVPTQTTIQQLKSEISNTFGIEKKTVKLMITGVKKFNDFDTLESLNIKNGSPILVIGNPVDVRRELEEKKNLEDAREIARKMEEMERLEKIAAEQRIKEELRLQQELEENENRKILEEERRIINEERQKQMEMDENASISFTIPVFSAIFAQKTNVSNTGDQISLPPSILEEIIQKKLVLPLTFRLTHEDKSIHVGVLDFTSPPNTAYVPFRVMRNLGIEEGTVIKMDSVKLPKGTFARLQPHSIEWLFIPEEERKSLLEQQLQVLQSLTIGNFINIVYSGAEHSLTVLDLSPSDSVDIINCDLTVDIEEPIEAEVYQFTHLELGETINDNITGKKFKFYSCSINSPYTKLKIKIDILQGSAKAFLSNQRRFPTQHNNQWVLIQTVENNRFVLTTPIIGQDDKDFVVGKYYLGIVAEDDVKLEIKCEDVNTDKGENLEDFEMDIEEERELTTSQKLRFSLTSKKSDDGVVLQKIDNIEQERSEAEISKLRQISQSLINLEENKNNTLISIRLLNGSTIQHRFNFTDSLQDVKNFVDIHCLPEYGGLPIPHSYSLCTDFPRVEHKKWEMSLQQLGLTDRKINLRIKPE